MNATSSCWVVGYTVVVAPPADMIARSARIHSIRVPEAIATRSSRSTPSDSSPAAIWKALSLVCVQVRETQRSPSR